MKAIDIHVHMFSTTNIPGAWAGDNSVQPDSNTSMSSAACHTASMSGHVVFCGDVLKANLTPATVEAAAGRPMRTSSPAGLYRHDRHDPRLPHHRRPPAGSRRVAARQSHAVPRHGRRRAPRAHRRTDPRLHRCGRQAVRRADRHRADPRCLTRRRLAGAGPARGGAPA